MNRGIADGLPRNSKLIIEDVEDGIENLNKESNGV